MTKDPLIDYTLHLADNALVLGHRNSEWTGHGPILEQDIALSNIALDQIGQARYLYQYAAGLINSSTTDRGAYPAPRTGEATEDGLAYHRDGWDFKNCLLVEQDNGDWAKTILRQFFFSAYQYFFYQQLAGRKDGELAAIAEKSYKEVSYHLRWSSEWVIRLGDGTEESHRRMNDALDQLWRLTGELYTPSSYEKMLVAEGIAVDLTALQPLWEQRIADVFRQAGLTVPALGWQQTGGKEGKHTEHLGYLLAEMQFLQRAYPGNEW
ncbi:MAG: phenylacetate-CoA oxygenase subunit PaaC [Bacteroidetes bacterium]|nr:phenylacetate-CoA oxygenase subunit PaaC [Bacteroidota bacterium]